MRLFEIFLVFAFMVLFFITVLKKNNDKVRITVSIISSCILAIQLIYEGYRVQLFFIYVFTVLLIISNLLKYTNRNINIKIPKLLKVGFYVIGLVLSSLSIFLAIYMPVFNLPELTGPYNVGTQTFHFIDNEREELATKVEGDKRELGVRVWYPTQNIEGKKVLPIVPVDKNAFNEFKKAVAEGGLGEGGLGFVFDYQKYIRSNTYENTELLASLNSFPVVIISHGFGTTVSYHWSQAETLASHGFVVVGVDHAYYNMITEFGDGRYVTYGPPYSEEYYSKNTVAVSKEYSEIWEADINFVINELEKINSGEIKGRFTGKLDMNHIGIMGHSFGGNTAFNVLSSNNKIMAGINMDGPHKNKERTNNTGKPFLWMMSDDYLSEIKKIENLDLLSNELVKAAGMTKEEAQKFSLEMSIETQKEISIINNALKHGATLINIKGTKHYNYTDVQLQSSLFKFIGLIGDIDGKRSTTIVNNYVLDFFNKHLKGIDGNLLNGPNSEYPEVEFKTGI